MQRDEDKDKGVLQGKAVSRRDFLKYAGMTGAAIGVSGGLGGLLAACGTKEETTTTAGPATTVVTGPEPPAQDKIRIGAARPISGYNAVFEQAHFGPAYKLWVEDVNAAGGIDVAGKKLPVEMVVYDDQSDMDLSMQAKLLRLLENKTFKRIGGTKDIKVDVRVISATNQERSTIMNEGRFRKDLFYRLQGVRITLPPLRDREGSGCQGRRDLRHVCVAFLHLRVRGNAHTRLWRRPCSDCARARRRGRCDRALERAAGAGA
jgi:hypothetical protein